MQRLLLLVFISLLMSCTGTSTDDTPKKFTSKYPGKKYYIHSMDGIPTTLDPIKASTNYSNFLVLNIFDTLYSYKYLSRPYELKPNLAIGMPQVSEDGLVYTIKIKPNVYFHDHQAFNNGKGRKLVAGDFVYSIKRHFDKNNSSQGAWLFTDRIVGLDDWKKNGSVEDQQVEGLQALDDETIRIQLIRPYPQLLYTLAMGFTAIVPKEVVDFYGSEFGSHPLGSGPFQLKSYNLEKAVLEKNPKFRSEPIDLEYEGYKPEKHEHLGLASLQGRSPPFLDVLEVHFVKESSARWNSFTKGNEIQYTWVAKEQSSSVIMNTQPLTLYPQISDNYNHMFSVEGGFVYSGFDMNNPTFGVTGDETQDAKNKALRCSIRQAYDWNQRNRAFYFGLGVVFPGVIVPAVNEFDPSLSKESVTTDIALAKQKLEEAGWTSENLPVLEYHVNGNVQNRMTYEQFRGHMNKIGYPRDKIVYKPYPSFGSFNKALKSGKTPFFSLAWTLDYPDSENTLQLFYGPNKSPGSNNFNYQNPEFDALFEVSKTMLPSPQRTQLYQKLNQMVIDDCVILSGLSRQRIYLWHKNIIMYPDREILGGFFTRYVDVAP